MSYVLEFEIPGLPKMTNSLRVHWTVKHRHAKHWKMKVGVALGNKNKPANLLSKAALTLTRCSSKSPDFDGLVSSFKHVIDALVDYQILENDTHACIGQPSYKWEKAPANKGKIKVKVEEIINA